MPTASLFSLLRLSSPALPIGAYSYSQGLESACEAGLIKSAGELENWLGAVLDYGLGQLDIPVFARIYRAWQQNDEQLALHWSAHLLAARETRELRLEERNTGRALARLLRDTGEPRAQICLSSPNNSLCLSFALAAVSGQLELEEAISAYCWSWAENQVAAAIKLVPLGQTDGQKVLMTISGHMNDVIQSALQRDDDGIYGSLPALAILSSQHETQYSRLFQS